MKFGILGVAGISKKVAKAIINSTNSKLIAISSRNIEKSKKFAEEFNIPNYYGSYEELLQNEEVEAVYIPLPTTMCLEWVILSAKAKKHVL
jgi:D-xylose 1-dehydrogenase (NADP+, D-xylono-1,5-lactone-forming)